MFIIMWRSTALFIAGKGSAYSVESGLGALMIFVIFGKESALACSWITI
jgi:hypothetical protein